MSGCVSRQPDLGGFSNIARTYVEAAAKNDSAAMIQMVSRSAPVQWALQVQKVEPELLEAASHELRPAIGEIRGDTAVVDFEFSYRRGTEVLGVVFTRDQDQWLISFIHLPRRM